MSDFRIDKIQINIPPQVSKKEKKETKEEKALEPKPECKEKAPEDVLDYMAKSAISTSIKGKKAVDVKKYVDEASQQRIEKIMQTFEETILKSAEIAIEEFGISEKAANDAAIVGFGRRFLS